MKTIMVVFGTRPEAIKMCPLVKVLMSHQTEVRTVVCVTGQHREMLDQVLNVFQIEPDYNLSIMKGNQTLFDITSSVLISMREVLEKVRPDIVLVHGDTTTSFAAGLAAFYSKIPIGHVEAGLRTNNLQAPFPEEFNRQGVDVFSKYYYAPTETAKQNLLKEGKRGDFIYVTGNTVIDALHTTIRADYQHEQLDWVNGNRFLLITAHRRENLGKPMHRIFRAIRRIVDDFPDVKAIYPIHMNPLVRVIAREELAECKRIRLIEPLDVVDFHNFLARSYMVLTDSGGIQEEAPSLGKPVLVLRDTTERPEGVVAGTLKVVGTNEEKIYEECRALLTDEKVYKKMACATNPYGDGNASNRIVEHLLATL